MTKSAIEDGKTIEGLRDQVHQVVFGEVDPRTVEKSVRKLLNRAKRQLNISQAIKLRMMLAKVFFWSNRKKRAKKQYLTVLRLQPESTEAMLGLGSLFAYRGDYAGAIRWMESARAICERNSDFSGQLHALDDMVQAMSYRKQDFDAAAAVIERMVELVDRAPDIEWPYSSGAQFLVSIGRSQDVVDYLERLLKKVLKYGYGRQWTVMHVLLAAYSHCGFSMSEARSKIEQVYVLCNDERSQLGFARALQAAFDAIKCGFPPEMYNIPPEWFGKTQVSEE